MVETKGVETSFIPKQTLSREFERRHEPLGLFVLISVAVLIIVLLFFAGAWGYRAYIKENISTIETNLQKEKEKLEHDSLIKFKRLDRQLVRAEALLNSHNTALPLFAFLEEQTLQTVRYNSLSYNGGKIDLQGSARSYESVALQSDVFADDVRVKDFIFSNLGANETGNVSFSLKLEIDPGILSFVKYLAL